MFIADVCNRRTGATLKDTGIRDEHGLEPVPSFSSPAKSPVKQNGVSNGSYADETMDIGDSMVLPHSPLRNVKFTVTDRMLYTGTIPEPTEVRRLRTSNVKFPLPQKTPPRRTHLNSSPRRSVGPMPSSGQRDELQTPTRASSHPTSGSKRKFLDLPRNQSRSSIERTPHSSGSLKRPRTTRLSGGRVSPKKPLDLSIVDDDVDETIGVTNGDVTTNGHDYEDTAMHGVEEDSVQMPQNDEDVDMVDQADAGAEELPAEPEPIEDPKPTKKGRGRPPKNAGNDSMLSLPGTPRGRRTKVHVDDDEESHAEASNAAPQKAKRSKKDKALKPVPAERGPNAKIRAGSKPRGKIPSRSMSRSRFVPRSETPGNGENALITRSGRHSIQPLAHWRGERAVLSPGQVENKVLTLGGIKEIIRIDELIDERPKKKYSYRRPRPGAKAAKLEDLEEEDEEQEPWEVETGVIHATVMNWDSNANHYIEEETEQKGRVPFPGSLHFRILPAVVAHHTYII